MRLLHKLGFAHSVECWYGEKLVGGLYGVAINGLFAGESMFYIQRDASKVTLVALVNRLRQRQFQLLDVQFMTEHCVVLGQLNCLEQEYKARLAQALQIQTRFGQFPDH